MPFCVVPAAGASSRMGTVKALLPWRGSTILETLTRALRQGGIREIRVVVAPDDKELQEAAESLDGVFVTVNPEPARGMLSSVLAGVEASVSNPTTRGPLLVCPVDHPLLLPDTVEHLLTESLARPDHILVPTFQGKRGHPLLIPSDFLEHLNELDPERGLRQLLEDHPRTTVEMPVADRGVIVNLNTPAQYRRYR